MQNATDARAIQSVQEAFSRLFRWGNLPRFRERFAARAGVSFDRASYSLIVPLGEGPMRVSDLAHRSGVDVSTASRQVVQLEAEGVVRRVSDVGDRRASILQLTPLGKRHLAKIADARQEILSAVLANFSEDEVRQLGQLLDRFNDSLMEFLEDDGE